MNLLLEKDFDIEAIIENLRPSGNVMHSGYRPAHKVNDNYLTTGEIIFVDGLDLLYGNKSLAYIKFITPEYYPNCLWVGKKIQIQEGSILTGYATITKIINKKLEK